VHLLFADYPNQTKFPTWYGRDDIVTWFPQFANSNFALVGRARRADFEDEMLNWIPDLYIGMGHGFYNYCSGQPPTEGSQHNLYADPLLACPGQYDGQNVTFDNTYLSAAKRVYFEGCDTLNVVAPQCMLKGCREWLGNYAEGTPLFQEKYSYYPSSQNPPSAEMCVMNDPYCKASDYIDEHTELDMLNGLPAKQVYQNRINNINTWLNYYFPGGLYYNEPERLDAIAWLNRSKEIFGFLAAPVIDFIFSKSYGGGAVALQFETKSF
jgi:hypothetical protein